MTQTQSLPPFTPRSGPSSAAQPAGVAPGTAPGQQSIGELVATVTRDLQTLVRAELELAKIEITQSVKGAGLGAGMLAAAGFIGLFALVFLAIALAEGITALGLPRWASYLIVAALFLLIVAILALRGIKTLKKIAKPERTTETLKADVTWLKQLPSTVAARKHQH